MVTHVALLRGINVGGKNRIPMADLREAVSSLGHSDVGTYIQSGNVWFSTPQTGNTELAAGIEEVIHRTFGLTIRVVVVTAEELRAVLSLNPYADEPEPRFVHAVFMAGEPDPQLLARLRAVPSGRDEVTSVGRVVYLHTPDGFGNSELGKAAAKWGTEGTARNMSTVTKLVSLCGGQR